MGRLRGELHRREGLPPDLPSRGRLPDRRARPRARRGPARQPECAETWGGGNLAAWFHPGHGVLLDSVNHFDLQGLETATGLEKPEDRRAYAIDHLGLTYAVLRDTQREPFWKKSSAASEAIKDLSVIRVVTNFVRKKRIEEE